MSSGIRKLDELLIRTLRNAQEHSKKAMKDPDIGPEAREILGNGIMEIEDQIRDLEGGSTKHAKGGAVMKKRGGTFKGTF